MITTLFFVLPLSTVQFNLSYRKHMYCFFLNSKFCNKQYTHIYIYLKTGQNCTREKNCTKILLHEDNFAPRVNLAQVTTLHGRSFFPEKKKKTKKCK